MIKEEMLAKLDRIKSLVDEVIGELNGKQSDQSKPRTTGDIKHVHVSFHPNTLAFMKQHSRGCSGPEKVTLLLARLTKGNIAEQVSSIEIEKQWNKMKSVLGGRFNSAYLNRAKANGWIDSTKHGIYTLTNVWNEVLKA